MELDQCFETMIWTNVPFFVFPFLFLCLLDTWLLNQNPQKTGFSFALEIPMERTLSVPLSKRAKPKQSKNQSVIFFLFLFLVAFLGGGKERRREKRAKRRKDRNLVANERWVEYPFGFGWRETTKSNRDKTKPKWSREGIDLSPPFVHFIRGKKNLNLTELSPLNNHPSTIIIIILLTMIIPSHFSSLTYPIFFLCFFLNWCLPCQLPAPSSAPTPASNSLTHLSGPQCWSVALLSIMPCLVSLCPGR